jgi:hypothetical protein
MAKYSVDKCVEDDNYVWEHGDLVLRPEKRGNLRMGFIPYDSNGHGNGRRGILHGITRIYYSLAHPKKRGYGHDVEYFLSMLAPKRSECYTGGLDRFINPLPQDEL